MNFELKNRLPRPAPINKVPISLRETISPEFHHTHAPNAPTPTMPANLIQYVSDNGNAIASIVPIEVWHEIESERETACLRCIAAVSALSRAGGVCLN
jgi:hypothetical protein